MRALHSTLMPTGMGVTNPKLSKGGGKLKEARHCTIPKILNKLEKEKSFWSRIENSSGKEKKTTNEKMHQSKFGGA